MALTLTQHLKNTLKIHKIIYRITVGNTVKLKLKIDFFSIVYDQISLFYIYDYHRQDKLIITILRHY